MYRRETMSAAAAVRFLPEMPRETVETIQISVRVPMSVVDELDALARELSPPGIDLSRADVLRAAIAVGVKRLREEGLPQRERPAPTRKR
jgi:hypothetical protein